jgi:hypothetical protein
MTKKSIEIDDPIIQVSGFGVAATRDTPAYYMLVALTQCGKVLLSRGDHKWWDVSPRSTQKSER